MISLRCNLQAFADIKLYNDVADDPGLLLADAKAQQFGALAIVGHLVEGRIQNGPFAGVVMLHQVLKRRLVVKQLDDLAIELRVIWSE